MPVASSLKIVHLPDLPGKGDVSDWFANSGGTKEKLFRLVETTANFTAEIVERDAGSGVRPLGFGFRTAAEYLSEVEMRSQKRAYWQGIIREGEVSLLVGRPYAGKSTFACALTRALVRGDTLLGRPCAKTRVCYMAFERNGQNVAQLFRTWGIAEQVMFADERPAFKGNGSELADLLEREIRERNLEVVIVDHLQNLVPLPDANDYATVSNAIEPFTRIAKKTGAHLMFLHHQGKGLTRGGEIDAMGSVAYQGASDVLIEASKSEGAYFIRATIRGGDELPKTSVTVDLEAGEVTAVEASQVRFNADKKRVCEFVDSQGGKGVTINIIQKETKIQRSTLLKILDETVEEGRLDVGGAGKSGDPRLYIRAVLSVPLAIHTNREPTLVTPEVEELGIEEKSPFPNLKGNAGNRLPQCSKTQYPIEERRFRDRKPAREPKSAREPTLAREGQGFTLGRSPVSHAALNL